MKVRTSALRGFALMALSALAFTACDEKAPVQPVPVVPVTVQVVPPQVTLNVGQTADFAAIVSNATNTAVTWTSSNTAVATVTATGRVTAVAPGNASIQAASVQDPSKIGAGSVTVNPAVAPTIQLVPATAQVGVNGTVQLVSVVTGSTATPTYTSSAPAVATVSATGLVTGVSAGTAVISATVPGAVPATSAITVTAGPPPAEITITITPTSASTGIGGTQQFIATVGNTTNTAVIWRSSDDNIATVDANGLATGRGQGTAIITAIAAADTTKRVQATLTVVGASVAIATIPVSPATGTLNFNVNVQVPPGTADSLVIRLTSATTGQVYQVRCQTFTAAGASTVVTCPITPADIDPNMPGAQVLPNDTYQVQAILMRADNVAATATFGTQLTTNNANTVMGVVTFDNSLVDNDNVAETEQKVDANGNVWFGGSATVTLTPSIFLGNPINTIRVHVDANCDGVTAGEAIRTVTIGADGTGTVTFSEAANQAPAAGQPGIDDLENANVCFRIFDPRDAANAAVTISNAGGTNNVVSAGTPANAIVGPGQNRFRIDNVQPAVPGAAMTLDPADFDGLTTGAYVGAAGSLTATGNNPTVLNAAGADAGVGGVTITYYAVPAASFNGASQTTLRASAEAGTAFTSPTQLQETITSTAYVLVVEVRDALGNRYFRGNAADLSFGVDLVAPTIGVVAQSSAPVDAVNPGLMQIRFGVTDENSGAEGVVGSVTGYSVLEVNGNAAMEVRCYDLAGTQIATPASNVCPNRSITAPVVTVGTTEFYDVVIPADENFYVFSFTSRDAAGNASTETITRQALVDVTAGPDAVAGLATVTINNYTIDNQNNTATINGVVRDNIEVAFSDARFEFAGLTGANAVDVPDAVPFTAPQVVGTYGLPLTAIQNVSATTQVNVDAVYLGGAAANANGANVPVSRFGFGMTDLAANFAFDGVAVPAGAVNGITLAGYTLTSSQATIDRTPAGGANPPLSTTLTVTATVAPGAANPFARTYLYYVHPGADMVYGTADDHNVLIQEFLGANATMQTGETARTFTHATTLAATSLPANVAGFAFRFFSISVAADGDAVISDVVTVNVQN
jgi:uncharacterized protein YjdB